MHSIGEKVCLVFVDSPKQYTGADVCVLIPVQASASGLMCVTSAFLSLRCVFDPSPISFEPSYLANEKFLSAPITFEEV